MLTVVLKFVTLQTNHTLQKGSSILQGKTRVSRKGQKQEQQKVKTRLTQCVTVPMLHTLVRHHSVWFIAKRRQTIALCQRQSQPLVDEIQLCSSSEPWEKFCTVKVSSVFHYGLIGHFWVAIFLFQNESFAKPFKMCSAYTVDIDYKYMLFWDFFFNISLQEIHNYQMQTCFHPTCRIMQETSCYSLPRYWPVK